MLQWNSDNFKKFYETNPKDTPDPFSSLYLKEHGWWQHTRVNLKQNIDQRVKDLESMGNFKEAEWIRELGQKRLED